MSTVAIVHEPHIDHAIGQVLDLVGQQSRLFTGRHVAIKPNETWASSGDRTACTQPDTLQAVIRYVKRFRPARITVSGGAGAGQTAEIFRLLGIDRVIAEEGVEFFDHNRGPFQAVALHSGPQAEVMVNPHILSYDTLVSLAQLKVHDAAGVTLTMKNIAMSFPAADYYGHPREKYHSPHEIFKDLQSFIAAMCQRFPPALAIIAGHPAMTGQGPIGGKVFETGLVLASTDFVACDALGAYLLGKKDVRHILLGQALRLGVADPRAIEIRGVSLEKALGIFTIAHG